ncbi:MAG: hypothetical protein L0Z50_32130 [Verrucomicrobiales bacterium]|nr:hypothetical protein [Verrucomicrobiales bacterium]
MRFPVVVNGEPMPAECGFATLADLKVVSDWTRIGKASREPAVQDAAEFAGLACKRWRFYRKAGRFARGLEELRDVATRQPEAELALLLVARAPWQRPTPHLGVCLCRRTWSSSLCVDFLAANPAFLAPDAIPIAGIGRGLLYFATEIAVAIRAKHIWGEATALSAGAYRHMFGQPHIEDFFRLNRAAYRRFRAAVRARWALSPLAGSEPEE